MCIDCEIFRKNDVEACKHTPAKFAKEIKRNTELREKRDHYLPRIARQRAETAGKRKYVTKNEFGRFSPPKTTITKTKEGYSDLQQEDLVANYAQWCKAHKGKDPLAEGWTIDWLDSPDGEKIKVLKKPKQVDDAGVPLMTMAAGRRHGVQLSEVHGVMEDAPEGLGDTHAIFESLASMGQGFVALSSEASAPSGSAGVPMPSIGAPSGSPPLDRDRSRSPKSNPRRRLRLTAGAGSAAQAARREE